MPSLRKLRTHKHKTTNAVYGRLANPNKAFRHKLFDSIATSFDESFDDSSEQSFHAHEYTAIGYESYEEELGQTSDALLAHLLTKFGGEKKRKEAKQFVRTFRSIIKYSFDKNEEWKQLPLQFGIRKIMQCHYSLIGEYLEQFVKHLKSGTLLNYWNFILTSLRWYHFDCELNTKRCKGSIEGFENYMKRLRKAYKRALKRETLASSRTYEQLVEQGRLPSGGLQELFGHTKRKLAWVLSLEAKDFKNKQVYNDFTDWLYSAFWVSMIQGRNSGLEDMKYCQRHGLLNPTGHETSSNFKTAMFHDMQALSSSDLFSIGMEKYVEQARKQVASEEMYDDDSPLFLTFTGVREYRVGAKVKRTYHTKMHDDNTTNNTNTNNNNNNNNNSYNTTNNNNA
jgi:hypothetical protein